MSAGDKKDLPPCWGIGLGRTGTLSFCKALKILGYRKVIHNPQFEDLRHLNGGADLGVALFYKYLDFKFPESRFVLTVRPLEAWLPSVEYILRKHPATARNDIAVMRRIRRQRSKRQCNSRKSTGQPKRPRAATPDTIKIRPRPAACHCSSVSQAAVLGQSVRSCCARR